MIEVLKDRRTALWAAVGMLFLYQTPKTVAVIGGLSRWDGPAAVAEGIAFSIFVELAVIYFALNGRRWLTLVSMVGMIAIGFDYYKAAIMSGSVVAIVAVLLAPVLIWQITEEVNRGRGRSSRHGAKNGVRSKTEKRPPRDMDEIMNRAIKLLNSGHSMRTVADVVKVPRATLTRKLKERDHV